MKTGEVTNDLEKGTNQEEKNKPEVLTFTKEELNTFVKKQVNKKNDKLQELENKLTSQEQQLNEFINKSQTSNFIEKIKRTNKVQEGAEQDVLNSLNVNQENFDFGEELNKILTNKPFFKKLQNIQVKEKKEKKRKPKINYF
jgi:glutamyl-tRNA reductase